MIDGGSIFSERTGRVPDPLAERLQEAGTWQSVAVRRAGLEF
jgi:hypothetical protein